MFIYNFTQCQNLWRNFLFANAPLCNSSNLNKKNHTLSIGEHHEVSLENVEYYNVGNKEILATKANSKEKAPQF